jgi:hypothetical protein
MFELGVAPAVPLQLAARRDRTEITRSNSGSAGSPTTPVSMRHLKVAVDTKFSCSRQVVLRFLGS